MTSLLTASPLSIKAFLLGIIQGVTEFFPVSSSAHLHLVGEFLGIHQDESLILSDLFCHLGTSMALVVFFRKEILLMLRFYPRQILLYLAALLPLIPIYVLSKPIRLFFDNSHFLGIGLLLTSSVLFFGAKQKKQPLTTKEPNLTGAFAVGISQGFALFPGLSRSGLTIVTSRYLNWPIEKGIQFSFLLSIPTILGGTALEIGRFFLKQQPLSAQMWSHGFVSFLSAFIVGSFVLPQALKILSKGSLKPFAWYCLSLGAVLTLMAV